MIYPCIKCKIFIQSAIAIVSVLLIIAINIYLDGLFKIMYLSTILCALTGFYFAVIHIPIYFSCLSYEITKTCIKKNSGFIRHKTEIISKNAIQHYTSLRAPFFFYGILLTAQGSNMFLPFLDSKDLEKLERVFINEQN